MSNNSRPCSGKGQTVLPVGRGRGVGPLGGAAATPDSSPGPGSSLPGTWLTDGIFHGREGVGGSQYLSQVFGAGG